MKFYVETGNWKAIVNVENIDSEIINYEYIEAATRVFDILFTDIGEFGIDCELINLINENGHDYFDDEYPGDLEDVPEATFGLLTVVYKEKDMNKEDGHWYFLTSTLFENASQPYNAITAKEIENKYEDQVKKFKQYEIDEHSGDIPKKTTPKKTTPKKTTPKKTTPKKTTPKKTTNKKKTNDDSEISKENAPKRKRSRKKPNDNE